MNLRSMKGAKVKGIEPNFHLKVSLAIIYYLGCWPPSGRYRYPYIACTVLSFVLMLGIFLLVEVANLIAIWGDVPQMVAGATLLMTNFVHAFKLGVVLFGQKRIQGFLDTARSDLFVRCNDRYGHVLTRYTWRGIFHHAAYQSFGTMAVSCWAFTPVIDLVKRRGRNLPMVGWYPFNATASPAFEIVCAHQSVAIFVACFHNIAMDTLITGLITVACCQLAVLMEDIGSIGHAGAVISGVYAGDKGLRPEDDADETYGRLKLCAEHSDAIFDFAEGIQRTFGTIIFFQFFVNCLIICLTAFHISRMTVYVPEILIGMLMYLSCMTYQIFIFCWHGNELHLHSSNVALAAYSSNWYANTRRYKQALQIIIARSYKPLVLRAGNMMTLSLNTFVAIMRMSYSIFTVLRSATD